MKSVVVYYQAILLPLPFLVWLSSAERPVMFMVLLLVYALPYRTIIDGLRLVNKKLLKPEEVWKLLIPWKRMDYVRELYFKK